MPPELDLFAVARGSVTAPAGCGKPNPAVEKVAAKSSCCGGPPKARADACCVKDEKAKDEGKAGCGCGPSSGRNVGEVGSTNV